MIAPILVLLLGLGVAAAAATIGVSAAAVSQLELTRWVQYKLRGAGAAAHLQENPGRVLATANALTTLGIIVAAAAVPALMANSPPSILALISAVVGVPVFVIAVYVVPRVVGRRWAERVVARAVPWMDRVSRILGPILPHRDPSTRTALAAVLTATDTHALASADEMAVVSGVLAFADRPVRELMTPRTSIVAIPEGMLAAEAAHVFTQSGYSRYPVYQNSLDQVSGVVHAFDLLRLSPDAPVPVRPALLVPATKPTADLMLDMQRGRGHLAVVLDEFGGTAGLVTFDDLLKNLVHEVFEEPGPVAEAEAAPRVVEFEGSAPAVRLSEAMGVSVRTGEVQTVGGLLIQALGRIPKAGERFLLRGLEFDVLAASATRVDRVAVRPGPVQPLSLERSDGVRRGAGGGAGPGGRGGTP